ncbi:hypothetical protein BHE74_00011391 [Ensete ventricosum]|nr:hypothetical protein BHE74_00011391 [Ensete ventricosum]RZR76607.1 hypothetical protein BHM03_00001430 [Ensete ventricosum]
MGNDDVAGQQLAATTGRWLRAGEGGGCGVSVRSAQQWLRLRATEAAVEAALEEKGRCGRSRCVRGGSSSSGEEWQAMANRWGVTGDSKDGRQR